MNNFHLKQIYLLTIIIGGIISLSVYSTYSIFTLESSTSDIVSIHTPNSLSIFTEKYEYKQLTVPNNSAITTDIDLYNNFDYELCYSAWYKVVESVGIDINKVSVYQNTSDELTASGTIEGITNHRINILIINDNDIDTKVNVGLSYAKNGETCELNISQDKSIITSIVSNPQSFVTNITNNIESQNQDAGFLTYKNNTKEIVIPNEDIFISSIFTYKDEVFTLNEQSKISAEEIVNYKSNETTSYYTCLNNETCQTLYRIIDIKEDTIDNEKIYTITKYDSLIGYMAGESGIRKISNNYIYYGDNPNNFVYYNCKNYDDIKTCELWRIIGIYEEEPDKYFIKIIRNDSIDSLEYDKDLNLWNNSSISKYLNEEYKINDINTVTSFKFKQENILNLDTDINKITYLDEENTSVITLMNLSDYLNTSVCIDKLISEYDSTCLNNNWLNRNTDTYEWTMTTKYTKEEPKTEIVLPEEDNEEEVEEEVVKTNNTVYAVGKNYKEVAINEKLDIRPVKYLGSRTFLISGSGTLEDPYIIR